MNFAKRLVLSVALTMTLGSAMAQYYSGDHTFDGTNKNEASLSLTTGKNIITGPCIGNTVHYKHYFNDHWSLDGGMNVQYTKGFYGLKVHEEALKRGVRITGATVHFVNEIPDGGKILIQKPVEVKETDTPEILQKRVMEEAEWIILPEAVRMVSERLEKEKR